MAVQTIGYKPPVFPQDPSGTTYPVILAPAPGSPVLPPRPGRLPLREGAVEAFAQELSQRLRDCGLEVSTDLHLPVRGRPFPYEPDIVVHDPASALYIDVQVDAPYDGTYRVATRFLDGRDSVRDTCFVQSGWVVLRLCEDQVAHYSSRCAWLVEAVAACCLGRKVGQCDPRDPGEVVESFRLPMPRWTRFEAMRLERERSRERSLGIDGFMGVAELEALPGAQALPADGYGFDVDETAFRRTAVHPQAPAPDASGFLPGEDTMLVFGEEGHVYYDPRDLTGNTDYTSVTSLLSAFFPFDEERLVQRRVQDTGMDERTVREELSLASAQGTYLHRQIELFLKGGGGYDSSIPEWPLFEAFMREKIAPRGLEPAYAELPVALPGEGIAGTVDSLFRRPDGSYTMIDWKRSTHLVVDGRPRRYGYGRGLSVLSRLDDCSYNQYLLQQSFYKYILERRYGLRIYSMVLCVLHPDYPTYYTLPLKEDCTRDVEALLRAHSVLDR